MPGYKKATLDDFKERLAEGKYDSIAGARRGIGRMDVSEAEKKHASALIDKYFGASTEGKAKPKKAAKKAAKSKVGKVARKAKAAAKAPKAKAPKAARAPRQVQKRGPKANGSVKAPAGDVVASSALRIGTIQQALKAMQDTKALGTPADEVAAGAREAQRGLTAIVAQLCPTEPTAEDIRQAEVLGKAAKAAGIHTPDNGAPTG